MQALGWHLPFLLILRMVRQRRSKGAPINVRSVAIAQSTAENEREEGQATDSVGNWIVGLTKSARQHQ